MGWIEGFLLGVLVTNLVLFGLVKWADKHITEDDYWEPMEHLDDTPPRR